MRQSRLRLASFATLLFTVCSHCGSAPAQEKVELRLRLQKGQTFEQIAAIQQKTSQTVFQKHRIDMTVLTRLGIHTEVTDVQPDGAFRLKSTYKTVSATTAFKIPGMPDNAGQPGSHTPRAGDDALQKLFDSLTGQSITYTITPQGKLTRIEGVEALVERMIASTPLPAAQRKEFTGQLQKFIKEQSMQSSGFAAFPATPVGVGDSWEVDTPSQLLGTLSCQLLARQNGLATIVARSTMKEYPLAIPAVMPENMKVSFELSGTEQTQTKMDEANGWPLEYEAHQRLLGKITMTVQQPAAQNNRAQKPAPPVTWSWPVYMKTTVRSWTVMPPR